MIIPLLFIKELARRLNGDDNNRVVESIATRKEKFRLNPLLSSAGRAQDCNCSTSNRYLEARGSIPRGETIFCLMGM